VTLLDSYALIAFLVGGPATAQVRAILRETLDVSQRRYGLTRAMELIEPLLDGVLTPLPLDVATAARAAELRARHYDRATLPLSLADAILIASATAADRIATADVGVLAVATAEGIGTITLPEQH
jgi:predicted nucleic acid-binding protein